MFFPERIGHGRDHLHRLGHRAYRGPGRVDRLVHRLTRWLRLQAGRAWRDVVEGLDERLRDADERDEVRREARCRIVDRLGGRDGDRRAYLATAHGKLSVDRETGRLVWEQPARRREELVSVQELRRVPARIRG